MRRALLLLSAVLLAATCVSAQLPPNFKAKWLAHEAGTSMYVFPHALPDDTRVCIEVAGHGDVVTVACMTAKRIREHGASK